MADVFNLMASLTLDTKDYDKNIKEVENKSKKASSNFKTNFTSASKAVTAVASGVALVAGSLTAFIVKVSDFGSKIDENSQRLGMSQKAYQEWSYVLKQNGSDIESMSTSMKTFNGLMLDAENGNANALITFQKLNLNFEEFEGLSVDEQFAKVVEQFQKMPAGIEKSNLAVEIFGRQGMDLLPLLNSTAESTDALRQRFYELGIYLSEDEVAAMAAVGDQSDDLKLAFQGVFNQIGVALMPAFMKITDWILNNKTTFLWISGFVVGFIATMWLLNAAISANPAVLIIGAIIVAISALVVGILWLKENWEIVTNFFRTSLLTIGDWFTKLWGSIAFGVVTAINYVIKIMNKMVEGILYPLNLIIRGLNKIPGVNINEVHWTIPNIALPDIPKFAKGGVFEANKPFLGMLGDQTTGRNIETPESVMANVFKMSMRDMQKESTTTGDIVSGITATNGRNSAPIINIKIGDKEIKTFIVETVENTLSSRGLKSLNKIGGYSK